MYITGTKRPTPEPLGANKPVLAGQKAQKVCLLKWQKACTRSAERSASNAMGRRLLQMKLKSSMQKDVCSNTK
jgi:hypothetical protein